ncbi:MAG: ketoacyl-synthetase C-terminal extension domain-containing protein, partial [Desulfosarcinaceae bacterium]
MVYAALQGWGISSDGRGSGITAPSVPGQVHALEQALARTPFKASRLDFIEGHGTGTAVGDRTELGAIAAVLAQDKACPPRACGVTSLKSIIGHAKAASGIGGLIKAVIAVNRRVMPPTAGCRLPHPIFDDQARCLYPVLYGEKRRSNAVLRAGVSSMGFGGINCHITLTSADPPSPRLNPDLEETALMASSQESELFVLTGRDSASLSRRARSLAREASGISMAEMADFAFDLSGRIDDRDAWRGAVVAGGPDDLAEVLDALSRGLDQGTGLDGKTAP